MQSWSRRSSESRIAIDDVQQPPHPTQWNVVTRSSCAVLRQQEVSLTADPAAGRRLDEEDRFDPTGRRHDDEQQRDSAEQLWQIHRQLVAKLEALPSQYASTFPPTRFASVHNHNQDDKPLTCSKLQAVYNNREI